MHQICFSFLSFFFFLLSFFFLVRYLFEDGRFIAFLIIHNLGKFAIKSMDSAQHWSPELKYPLLNVKKTRATSASLNFIAYFKHVNTEVGSVDTGQWLSGKIRRRETNFITPGHVTARNTCQSEQVLVKFWWMVYFFLSLYIFFS